MFLYVVGMEFFPIKKMDECPTRALLSGRYARQPASFSSPAPPPTRIVGSSLSSARGKSVKGFSSYSEIFQPSLLPGPPPPGGPMFQPQYPP